MTKEIFKSYELSRAAYREYVMRHILAVQKMFANYGEFLVDIYLKESFYIQQNGDIKNIIMAKTAYNILSHDASKLEPEEFDAYAAKFYPCESDLVDKDRMEAAFDRAWTHHYTHNKHHPEYWVYSSDPKSGTRVVKMPHEYFIEMICDWMAVSYTLGGTVKDWWYKGAHKEKSQILSTQHIQVIEAMLNHPMDILTRELASCEIP